MRTVEVNALTSRERVCAGEPTWMPFSSGGDRAVLGACAQLKLTHSPREEGWAQGTNLDIVLGESG
jgi:hypothetical protein